MKVDSYKEGNFCIIKVGGRMDAVTAPEFEKACMEWVGQGETTFVVDLEGLEYMSSAGLRSILILGKKLKSGGGSLSFSSLTPNVAHVFSISNFASLFPVHDSLGKALGNA
jgi:anti-anti-sigma factor